MTVRGIIAIPTPELDVPCPTLLEQAEFVRWMAVYKPVSSKARIRA